MTTKTEILNNLIDKIKANFPEFKQVVRGQRAIDDKRNRFPLCSINSYKTTINKLQSSYNQTTYTMYVALHIYNQTKSNYYSSLDDLEDRLLSFIDKLDYQKDLHPSITTIEIISSEEPINDEYVDNFYYLVITIAINFRKPVV